MKKTIVIIAFTALISLAFCSPGDSVGMTAYDFQRSGSFGQRLFVDSNRHVYIYWMKADLFFYGWWDKRMQLNIRNADGTYHGAVIVSGDSSGFGTIDVARDTNPDFQRLVVCYHHEIGYNQYYPFIDVDSGNGTGAFPNDPKHPPNTNNILWPCVACANNGNIIMAAMYSVYDQHLFVTTDYGLTWANPENFDSVAVHSHFVRASNNPGSNKVVFTNTKYITDSVAMGMLDNDVYYMLSTDGGVTWGPHTNITHYQPQDSIRGWYGTNAVFDLNDNLHVVWTGRHVSAGMYWEESKIFHWDEVSNTISAVSGPNPIFPGGWWGWIHNDGYYGSYRLPADEPQMIVDRTTGWLYCMWHGQTDTSDYSLAGWPNGDFYGAFSTDGGLTWDAYGSAYGYVNLTNTHTPGAPTGQCEDEDFMTANPFTVNDSIFITYIEDKDAGICVDVEGDTTDNPVRMWVFHKSLISGPANVEEVKAEKPTTTDLTAYPNPFRKTTTFSIGQRVEGQEIKIYDIGGRLVKSLSFSHAFTPLPFAVIWLGDDANGHVLPAGVYVCRYEEGAKTLTSKIVKLE